MKRKLFFLILLVFGLAVMVSAQDRERRERDSRRTAPETVTVTGSMVVANGMPALRSGSDTYLIGGISRLVGFIDGLREGAQVTIEGTVMTAPRNSELKYLRPSKLTLGGRTYDLELPWGDFVPDGRFMNRPDTQTPRQPNPQQPRRPRSL